MVGILEATDKIHLEVMGTDHLHYSLRARWILGVSQGAGAEKSLLGLPPHHTLFPSDSMWSGGRCFTVAPKTRGEAVIYGQYYLFGHKFGLIAICFILGHLLRYR